MCVYSLKPNQPEVRFPGSGSSEGSRCLGLRFPEHRLSSGEFHDPFMKILGLAFFLLLIGATPALAQAHIIKQRAKELNQQNNARQGITPAAPATPAKPNPAAPATGTAATAQPVAATPELMRRIDASRLKTDLTSLNAGAVNAAALTEQLAKDLLNSSRGSAKATSSQTSMLARHLNETLGKTKLSSSDQTQFIEDMLTLLNCGGQPDSRVQAALSGVQFSLQKNGADKKAASSVVDDLRSISREIQKLSK